jgi:hypothetical protein
MVEICLCTMHKDLTFPQSGGALSNLGDALNNFGYLCTVHKHGLCTITCALINGVGSLFSTLLIMIDPQVVKLH